MKPKRKLLAAAVGAVLAPVFVVALPAGTASAHGYISSPPSRQANCASGRVPDCGQIVYEPQSVEGPKGLRSCNGGLTQFAVLNDDSKGWPATSVGGTVTFNWVLTARHSTSTWEYYIGNTLIKSIDDNGKQPGATVSHTVSLGGFTGRQKVLAVWNIADTANAFYSCVDLQIGGGGTTTPTPTSTSRPPTSTSKPPTSTSVPGGTWTAGKAYAAGDVVTYGGSSYRCLQPHTAIAGWEPPNTPALWQKL